MMINNTQRVEPTTGLFLLKIIFATICMFFGFFGVFFSFWKGNNYSVAPCLFLEIVCVLLINVNATFKRGKLFEVYTRSKLTIVFAVACVVCALTLPGAIFFLANGIRYKQDFQMEYDGYYFAMIPCLLAVINSLILVYDSKVFIRMHDQQAGGINRVF
ncbi:uncharacterized protein NPIL_606971 [Nephila pilipes]|uniref:Uncharacterized protein n=1 Tax=Nephila pilipes TaxID=299642 RepID=A0A8X6Q8Q5_NEPPI|nr:uncharacterized protein NPIL_606971 [Nephila pilipes]